MQTTVDKPILVQTFDILLRKYRTYLFIFIYVICFYKTYIYLYGLATTQYDKNDHKINSKAKITLIIVISGYNFYNDNKSR